MTMHYILGLDHDELDLLEEPNGIATAPSMITLNSQLEGMTGAEQEVSLSACICDLLIATSSLHCTTCECRCT